MRVAVVGNEAGRRHDAEDRMTHADERLGAAQGEQADVDLGLVPELEPARPQRLGDVDRGRHRRLERDEAGDARAELVAAIGRGEDRQHGKAAILAAPLRRHHRQVGIADQQDAAGEMVVGQMADHGLGFEVGGGGRDQDEIGHVGVEERPEGVDGTAFAGHEAELLQRLAQEPADVGLGREHAGTRRDVAATECAALKRLLRGRDRHGISHCCSC